MSTLGGTAAVKKNYFTTQVCVTGCNNVKRIYRAHIQDRPH